jgi:hypothetical protein
MPDPNFIGLIYSLTAAAEAALGEINLLTSRLSRDGIPKQRQTAERSLKLLETLAQKTRGNLDREEAAALSNGIANLRLALAAMPDPNSGDSSGQGQGN